MVESDEMLMLSAINKITDVFSKHESTVFMISSGGDGGLLNFQREIEF